MSAWITVYAINKDEKNQTSKMDQVILDDDKELNKNDNLQDTSKDMTEDTSEGNITEAAAENDDDNTLASENESEPDSSITKEGLGNYNIVVENEADDSDCNFTIAQVVSIGLASIEKKTGIKCDGADVRVSRYNVNESVIWNCVAEVNSTVNEIGDEKYRFEFEINGNSGKIISSNKYYLEKASDDVWVLDSDLDTDTIEKKIDQQKIDAYTKLEINADSNINIEVLKGDSYSISAKYYGSQYEVSHKIIDGTLKIISRDHSNSTLSNINKTNILTLTVPEGITLDIADVDLSCGNYTMENISVNSIDVNLECGNFTMNGVSSLGSIVYVEVGNAEITDSICKEMSTEIEAGNIDMYNCTSDKCNISLDTGDVELGGKLTGQTECTVSVGDVNINCSQTAENYDYMLISEMGRVTVDDRSSMTKLSSNNNAANTLNVSVDMGTANLSFN